MPWRILYIARAPFFSGAERALLTILRHLDRRMIEPAVLLGAHGDLVDQIRSLDIPFWIVPWARRSLSSYGTWRRWLRGTASVIRTFQPCLLHANDVPSAQAISFLGRRYRLPRLVHIRWPITAAELAWWAPAGAECLLFISRWVRDQLGSPAGTPLENARLEILHDAVDWPASQSVPPADDSPSDFPDHPLVLGFAGQIIPDKGLDLIFQALARLPANRRPQLLIAGRDTQSAGAYQKELEHLAASLGLSGHVRWLGFLSDMSAFYRQVDLMVCPSRIEPLGLIPLEAARFARPTAAHCLGGFLETILHEQTGFLIQPSVEAWVQFLENIPPRPRLRQLGQAAYHRAAELFSPQVYHDRLYRLYDQLIRSTAS